jgi:hypothetical protein
VRPPPAEPVLAAQEQISVTSVLAFAVSPVDPFAWSQPALVDRPGTRSRGIRLRSALLRRPSSDFDAAPGVTTGRGNAVVTHTEIGYQSLSQQAVPSSP